MDKKYLFPIVVGAGVIIAVLALSALLSGGNEEGAGGVAIAAAAFAEMARRRRAASGGNIEAIADGAEDDISEAEALREEVAAVNDEIDTDTGSKPLADLVDEENERFG